MVFPFKESGLPFIGMRALGYPVSRRTWNTCDNISERPQGIELIKLLFLNFHISVINVDESFTDDFYCKKMKGGGEALSGEMQSLITSYAENRSTVAANRLVIERVEQPGQLVKQLQPVRYLDENFSELYNQFPFRDELSKSSFVKYLTISGKFRKPHRLSDLCEYCETVRIFLSLFFLILSYLKNVSQ